MLKPLRARKRLSSALSRWIPMRNSAHIRWSRVMTAQARIAMRYYDREDVKERVLDAVLEEFEPVNAARRTRD